MDHVALYQAEDDQGEKKAEHAYGGEPKRGVREHATVHRSLQHPRQHEIENSHHAHGDATHQVDVRMGEGVDEMARRAGLAQPLGDAREGLNYPLHRSDEQVYDRQNQKTKHDGLVSRLFSGSRIHARFAPLGDSRDDAGAAHLDSPMTARWRT